MRGTTPETVIEPYHERAAARDRNPPKVVSSWGPAPRPIATAPQRPRGRPPPPVNLGEFLRSSAFVEPDGQVRHRRQLVLAGSVIEIGALAASGMRSSSGKRPASDAGVITTSARGPRGREQGQDVGGAGAVGEVLTDIQAARDRHCRERAGGARARPMASPQGPKSRGGPLPRGQQPKRTSWAALRPSRPPSAHACAPKWARTPRQSPSRQREHPSTRRPRGRCLPFRATLRCWPILGEPFPMTFRSRGCRDRHRAHPCRSTCAS